MRVAVLALAAALGSMLFVSPADAQWAYGYGYGNGAYPVVGAQTSGYPTVVSYYGGYPAVNYYAGYVGPSYGGYANSSYGILPDGLGYLPRTPMANAAYGGVSQYSQYGLRRYGSGRTFGSYSPRVYRTYQPRTGGLFDR